MSSEQNLVDFCTEFEIVFWSNIFMQLNIRYCSMHNGLFADLRSGEHWSLVQFYLTYSTDLVLVLLSFLILSVFKVKYFCYSPIIIPNGKTLDLGYLLLWSAKSWLCWGLKQTFWGFFFTKFYHCASPLHYLDFILIVVINKKARTDGRLCFWWFMLDFHSNGLAHFF